MAKKTLVLGDSEAIMKKEGLGESVALWEDGQRCDTGPGFFEWWYFDARLEDGSTAVVVFSTKPFTERTGPAKPGVRLVINTPDGRELGGYPMFGSAQFSAVRSQCDVKISHNWVRGDLHRYGEGFAVRRDRAYDLTLEVGRVDGGATYLRLAGTGLVLVPLGATRILARAQGGIASASLPAHRAFVLGGRGTLLGDEFRAWGGRGAALLHLEWRVPAPFPSLSLGSVARTPRSITLAPYAAAGWSDRPVAATPWRSTGLVRVTTGLGLEWLGVFRLEAGYGVQSHRAHVAFDVTRDFWRIL